jgi:cysteine desulfurase/selenocysteine lyase
LIGLKVVIMSYDQELELIRKDFPIIKKKIYMNNGSFAPVPLSTIKAITGFLLKYSEEGPDSNSIQEYITSLIKEVRQRISHLINCGPEEIIFTQSTTDGLNLVSSGMEWNKSDLIVTRGGPDEHFSNYFPWLRVAEKFGVELGELKIDSKGFFDIGELEKFARNENTKLITLSHALYNNGAIMPVSEVGKIARENNVLFCIDAAQSVGSIKVDVKEIGCDFLAFPGFKWICGPVGVGILYCSKKSSELLTPQSVGSDSAILTNHRNIAYVDFPHNFQAGFRNYVGIAGLESSLRYILRIGINNIRKMNMKIASELNSLLEGMKDVSTYGPQDENLRTSIVSFGTASLDARTIVTKLDNFGITLAERTILQSGKKKAVRASPHFFNSQSEVETIVSSLKTILK